MPDSLLTVKVLAWVDSDSLVVSSLHSLLAQADRLEEPGSARPGPRIGASYDGEWYDDVIYRGRVPALGSPRDDINTGVFIIKPGVYSFLKSNERAIKKYFQWIFPSRD